MVSTRHHPKEFPEPNMTPTSTPPKSASPSNSTSTLTSTTTSNATLKTPGRPPRSNTAGYTHHPDRLTMIWLFISLPLVLWDTSYVLLRPHTMPGGKIHSPIWTPYGLYGTIDHVYGWPAWERHDGFTGALGSMSLAETIMYGFYLGIVVANGKIDGRTHRRKDFRWLVWDQKKVEDAGLAVLVLWAAAVMTLSKTWLFFLHAVFSGFETISHNSPATLFLLWVFPNASWIVFSTYMVYVTGKELWTALESTGKVKR